MSDSIISDVYLVIRIITYHQILLCKKDMAAIECMRLTVIFFFILDKS